MKKISFAVTLVAAGLAATPGLSWAAGAAYTDADWTQATITSADGTRLHADVLRPKGFTATDKTPVIVSIGPYFNHSGQVGAAGPVQGAPYDPIGPNEGPSERFKDFVDGANLFTRAGPKYTFVMVDLRGFGGSEGCLDWGGKGESADVVAAVNWAASQPWSTGAVGTYGKSYDAMTGLIGAAERPPALKAVVAQEPVYDDYRYLYGDGIRRLNSLATPALYDGIAATPGPAQDDPSYQVSGASQDAGRPGCFAANFADQQNDDHYAPYWRERNLIERVKGSEVPIFVTQGMTENNTAPDGFAEFLANHPGPERGWIGPWDHVRGNERTGIRLAMGRSGWFDEVMRFYDQYLAGVTPAVSDPPFAVQSVTTGKWRPELQWPPADATELRTASLASGSYTDTAQSSRTGSTGVWTVSQPLPYDVAIAGAPTVSVDVFSPLPRSNLVVDLYDVDGAGKGVLVARQGSLIRASGRLTLRLMSADWTFAAGHRIALRVTDNNSDWWLAAVPTNQTVTVYGGELTLPFLTYERTQKIEGASSPTRLAWVNRTATVPADAPSTEFALPPALAPQPADMKAALDAFK